jgi:hypothetical protein
MAPAAPSQWNVTPDQTVQGQVKNIIADNSPLMQQAETRSLQKMNDRGGINSSMAIGAGQSALYDAALPIATADAATYARSGEVNNSANNQFATAANTQGFDMAKMDKSQGFDMTKMDKQFAENAAALTQKFGYDTQLTKMQSDSARETSNIAAQYRNLTQASSSAASLMNNSADHINQIMLNADLDAPAKQVAIDTYNANLNKSLQLIGAFAGDVDLSNMLDGLLA